MVTNQIINKILNDKSISIVQDNQLNAEYFIGYEDEYLYIMEHYDKYGNVPDLPTFLSHFNDFEPIEVFESERYLIDTIREEHLFNKSVPVIKKAADLLKQDANEASRYLMSEIQTLTPNYTVPFVDIIHDSSRIEEFIERSKNESSWCIPTGFPELDDVIHGWETSEEFIVIVARTNQGKSWILTKTMEHAWKVGKNVAYISPEMSANKLAYRFDTLNNHFSNTALMRGDVRTVIPDDYYEYSDRIAKRENKFLVSTPKDFNNEITVSKLRSFVKSNNIEVLAVDGITYMKDERYKRGDNKTTSLTNISEDIMQLSIDLGIPILVVVQSNRGGVKDDDESTPELEDIRDSDGIAHNATKVISLRQKDNILTLIVKKARYARVGDKLTYAWDIDRGTFEWMAKDDDAAMPVRKVERTREIKDAYEPKEKVVF